MCRVSLVTVALIASMMNGTARADPVSITSGALVFDFEGDFFTFAGSGFELHGTRSEAFIPIDVPGFCFPCRPGVDRLDYSFTTTGGEVSIGSGPAVWGGQSYDHVFYRAQLTASAAARTFPTSLEHFGEVSEDFTMTASLRAFLDPGFSQLAFSAVLLGSGEARTGWVRNSDGTYNPEEGQLVFLFSPSDPVPEPATIVLLGTGLAGLAYRRRLKRGSRDGRAGASR